jgi:thiamine pyrophosphate-dependent acetolactate synthase large subunit-like protein
MAPVHALVAEALAGLGHRTLFGLLGSGNFRLAQHFTDECGGRLVWARHEAAAVVAADAFAQVSRGLGVATVHQGPGLTNAVTALAHAARERTPLLLLTGETARGRHVSQSIDVAAVAAAAGADAVPVRDAATAAAEVAAAARRALEARRPVVVGLPIDLQAEEGEPAPPPVPAAEPPATAAAPEQVAAAAAVIARSERPVILAGRGAMLGGAHGPLTELGERIGALYATSLVGNGLFAGDEHAIGVCGGFSSDLGERIVRHADLVLAFGASLNQWTTMHRTLLEGSTLVHCDCDPQAIGRHVPADVALTGDAAATAAAVCEELRRRGHAGAGYRADALAAELRGYDPAQDFEEVHAEGLLDPRALVVALDAALPTQRTIVYDGGHFHWFPTPLLSVPDADGFLAAQGFQAIGLGLGSAIGAAAARPDRPVLLLIGDGGAMMTLGELDSLAAQRLPVCVAIFDDGAYGAEVHHFGPMGLPTGLVEFGTRDFAGVARSLGAQAATIRDADAVAPAVGPWAAAPDGPLVLDCKVNPAVAAERLAEAFKGGA